MAWTIEDELGNLGVVNNGQWTAPNADFLNALQTLDQIFPVPGHIPDADEWKAEKAVEVYGGRIVREGKPPDFVPGRVY